MGAQDDKATEAWLRHAYEKGLIRVNPSAVPNLWDAKLPKEDQGFLDPETRLYIRADKIRWKNQKLRLDGRRVLFYQNLKGEIAEAEAPGERYEFAWKGKTADSEFVKDSVGRLLENVDSEQIDWSGYWPPNAGATLSSAKSLAAKEVAPGVFRPGVGVSSPRCQFCPNPRIPMPALQGRSDAMVAVSALITETGHVAGMRVVESTSPRFSEAAVIAFSRWRYSPAIRDGNPVRVVTTIDMVFRIHTSP